MVDTLFLSNSMQNKFEAKFGEPCSVTTKSRQMSIKVAQSPINAQSGHTGAL